MRWAATTALLVACHGNSGHSTDSGAIDTPADARSTIVDVTVLTSTGDGAPDPTAIAVFTDHNGTVISAGMVDSNGHASAELPDGGDLTVLQAVDESGAPRRQDRLTTILGVVGGDQLVLGVPPDPAHRGGTETTMMFDYTPINTSMPPALFAACPDFGVNQSTITLGFYASCVTPKFDLLLLQDSMSAGRFYDWQPDNVYSAGDHFTMPDNWLAIGHNTTTFTNIPANLPNVAAELDVVIGGRKMRLDLETLQLPAPGNGTLSLEYVPEVRPMSIAVRYGNGINYVETHVLATTSVPDPASFDLAELPLPHLTKVMPAADGVAWSESRAGAPDARLVTWFGSWTAAGVGHDAVWLVEDDGSARAGITLPSLPAAYAADDPTTNSPTVGGASVLYFDYDNLDGYDAARPHGPALQDIESHLLDVDHRAHSATLGSP